MDFAEAKAKLSKGLRVKPYQIFEGSDHETQWYIDGEDAEATGFVEPQIVQFCNSGGVYAQFTEQEAVELLACGTEVEFRDLPDPKL